MAGLSGTFGYSAYAPTKWALKGFAEVMYQELLPYNIWISVWYTAHAQNAFCTQQHTHFLSHI